MCEELAGRKEKIRVLSNRPGVRVLFWCGIFESGPEISVSIDAKLLAELSEFGGDLDLSIYQASDMTE
jgi:hypothetical protein